MLASASSRYCQDWRSPGQTWTRTPLGWKPVRAAIENGQQRNDEERGGAETTAASCDSGNFKKRLRNKCALGGTIATSREVHQYVTLGDAMEAMGFEYGLYDEKCYYFICRVLLHVYDWLFNSPISSFQVMILKLTFTASGIAVSSNDPSKAVTISIVVDKALKVLERIVNGQSIERSLYQEKYDLLLKCKEDLNTCLDCSQEHFRLLHDDCIRCIVSYLKRPQDILNFGLANRKLHAITEESWVWSRLAQWLFQVDLTAAANENGGPIETKEMFKCQYMKAKIPPERQLHMYDNVACWCNCGMAFWKEYGHQCTGTHPGVDIEYKPLRPERFLCLFIV
ncbi:hypothetical protein EMCRGX_G034210 [Ephydatia muelleri]